MEWLEGGSAPSSEDILQWLHLEKGAVYATTIRAILDRNVASNRWSTYLSKNSGATLAGYVVRLAEHYDLYHEYLFQLQVKKLDTVWEPLLDKLRGWAYPFLGRFAMEPREQGRWAAEIANWAGVRLLHTAFPYDTQFDPWVCVLLQNVAREHVRRNSRWAWNAQEELVDWSSVEDWLGPRVSGRKRDVEEWIVSACDLEAAISQLSARQQRVIEMYYFDGHSFQEMAELIDGERSTLYKRHHDALNRLRQLLS